MRELAALDVLLIAPDPPGMPELAWLDELSEIGTLKNVVLTFIAKKHATRSEVANALRERHDIVIWSGHGMPGELILSDGSRVNGPWIATQARGGAPRVFIVSACMSAVPNGSLQRLADSLSQVGINTVAMLAPVADNACVVYNVEFVRAMIAGTDVGNAHRVALRSMADISEQTAQACIFIPGMTDGYRFIIDRIDENSGRLDRLEVGQREIKSMLDFIVKGLNLSSQKH